MNDTKWYFFRLRYNFQNVSLYPKAWTSEHKIRIKKLENLLNKVIFFISTAVKFK